MYYVTQGEKRIIPDILDCNDEFVASGSFPLFTTSDPAMKQFLLYLDEKMALGKKFILKDLDDTHVFILQEVVPILMERVGELMDQNSFPITQK